MLPPIATCVTEYGYFHTPRLPANTRLIHEHHGVLTVSRNFLSRSVKSHLTLNAATPVSRAQLGSSTFIYCLCPYYLLACHLYHVCSSQYLIWRHVCLRNKILYYSGCVCVSSEISNVGVERRSMLFRDIRLVSGEDAKLQQ